jgi:AcrR family transcriptional regulator
MEANFRKQRIIDATVEVLKEYPVEEVSMRKIAKKASVTTGSIYHHYKNKDELLFDVMKQTLLFTNKLYKAVEASDKEASKEELMNTINLEVRNRLKKTEEQKMHIHFFSDVIRRRSSIMEEYQNNYVNMINSTSELFEKTFDVHTSSSKKCVASLLVAAMDGIAMQQALDVLPEDLDDVIDVFVSFFNESIPTYLSKDRNK